MRLLSVRRVLSLVKLVARQKIAVIFRVLDYELFSAVGAHIGETLPGKVPVRLPGQYIGFLDEFIGAIHYRQPRIAADRRSVVAGRWSWVASAGHNPTRSARTYDRLEVA